jgi:hypothetical protein
VLGVSSDEMIDNMTIIIEELKGVFSKRCEPRYEIANNQIGTPDCFLGL